MDGERDASSAESDMLEHGARASVPNEASDHNIQCVSAVCMVVTCVRVFEPPQPQATRPRNHWTLIREYAVVSQRVHRIRELVSTVDEIERRSHVYLRIY